MNTEKRIDWDSIAKAVWEMTDETLDHVMTSWDATKHQLAVQPHENGWHLREMARLCRLEMIERAEEALGNRNEILAGC